MTLFRMVTPQHTYHHWLKKVAKTVAKLSHLNQTTNIEIVKAIEGYEVRKILPKRCLEVYPGQIFLSNPEQCFFN